MIKTILFFIDQNYEYEDDQRNIQVKIFNRWSLKILRVVIQWDPKQKNNTKLLFSNESFYYQLCMLPVVLKLKTQSKYVIYIKCTNYNSPYIFRWYKGIIQDLVFSIVFLPHFLLHSPLPIFSPQFYLHFPFLYVIYSAWSLNLEGTIKFDY